MREVKIYDFQSEAVKIEIPDKEICGISVAVLSGDEVVEFEFMDGTVIHEDSSKTRLHNFYDGSYFVEGENIEKWLAYKPSGKRTASYERQEMFEEEEE